MKGPTEPTIDFQLYSPADSINRLIIDKNIDVFIDAAGYIKMPPKTFANDLIREGPDIALTKF